MLGFLALIEAAQSARSRLVPAPRFSVQELEWELAQLKQKSLLYRLRQHHTLLDLWMMSRSWYSSLNFMARRFVDKQGN